MRKYRILLGPVLLLLSTFAWAGQIRQVGMMEIPGNPGFEETAVANGHLVITHPAANTVEILDLAKRRLVAQITGLATPKGIAVDDFKNLIFIANSEAKNILVVSSRDWKVQENIPLDFSPDALAWAPETRTLYASQARGDQIAAIDVAEKKVTSTAQLQGRVARLLFDRARNVLLVTMEDLNELLTLDLALKIEKRFRLWGSQPTGMAVDSRAGRIYVAIRYAVIAVNAENGQELSRVATPAGADALWFDEATRVLFAASAGGIVNVIQTENGKLLTESELHTEIRGHTLAFDPLRKLLYLPGGREGKSKLLILKRIEAAPLDQSAGEVAKR